MTTTEIERQIIEALGARDLETVRALVEDLQAELDAEVPN